MPPGAAAVALVLNLADRLVAGALGADFQVTISGTTQTVGAVMVTVMTLVPMLLGAVALVVASRRAAAAGTPSGGWASRSVSSRPCSRSPRTPTPAPGWRWP